MIKPESILRKIAKLREKHTLLFNAGKFVEMQTVDRKIILLFNQYHRANNS